ncbi:MAG: hypothetical protein FJX99_04195 [Bacteroidetes bacterium]|nr:hypothetical protein [Bacteroidota bacterium]
MQYKIFVLAILFSACQESDNSISDKSPDNKSITVESQSRQENIQKNKFEKDSVTTLSQNKKTNLSKVKKINSLESRPISTTSKKSMKENASKTQELNNEYQQKKEKWNAFYSEDSTWLELYKTSEESFIKGWENEFKKNPSVLSTINKPFLVQLFCRRMEKIFFNSPSFIQFSTDRFKNSDAFSRLQTNWKIPD